MLKEVALCLCTFMGLCEEPQSFSDVTKCEGDLKVCEKVISEVEAVIPNHIEAYIVKTVDEIVIVTTDFSKYMDGNPIDEAITESEYVGVTGYGYSDKTLIYSVADSYVLLHELGHALDFSYLYFGVNKYSNTDKWKEVYETEYITKRGSVIQEEYFAEAFAMYYHNPHAVEMFAPNTYKQLNNLLGKE